MIMYTILEALDRAAYRYITLSDTTLQQTDGKAWHHSTKSDLCFKHALQLFSQKVEGFLDEVQINL